MSVRIGSLFSGYGGLELGVQAVLGGETVWHVEFDAPPSKILAHHWNVPNYGDVTKVDWSKVEPVEVLTGGFPCQDVSTAGRRRGLRDGTRSGLWSEFAAAIDALRPELVVIENVRGLLSAKAGSSEEWTDEEIGDLESWTGTLGESSGSDRPVLRALGAVLGSLAELGYDAEWCGIRAADVGAPHSRYRVFIVAYPTPDSDSVGRERDRASGRGAGFGTAQAGFDSAPADSTGARCDCGENPGTGSGHACEGVRSVEPERDLLSPGHAEGGSRHERERETGRTAQGGDPGRPARDAARVTTPDSDYSGVSERAESGEPGDSPAERESTTAPDTRCDQCAAVRRGSCCGKESGVDSRHSESPAYPGREGLRGDSGESPAEEAGAQPGNESADPDGERPVTNWGPYLPAIERWETVTGRLAPPPTRPDGRDKTHRLNPEFVEWMMGLPLGHVTSPAIGLSRNQQLKALGNGVVPQQAAAAVWLLLERITRRDTE